MAAGQPGGASQLVANIHSELMQLMDMLGQMPNDQKALAQVVQGFQDFVDSLGQPSSGGQQQAQGGQGATTPEQGAAKTQPAM